MGIIYKIEIAGEIYIGSTKRKLLCQRQCDHNQCLNNPNNKGYNESLYKFCRTHNISKIICELLEKVDNENIRIKEQEYMNMLEPSLNRQRAFQTEEQKIEQKKECNKKHNKIKANCPICDKLLLKNYIKQHIRNIH